MNEPNVRNAQTSPEPMLKAVFWDMDGTLIDSEPYWHEGELKIAAENGGYWDEDLAWQGSGTPVPDVARRMVEHGCKLSIEEIGKGMIDYVAQKEFERIPWIDGVEDVLLSLKEAGIPSMLVTTSPRHLAENLIAQAPEELSDTLRLALDAMGDWLYSLPAELGRWALDALRRLAQRSPDVLLFAVTAGIGSYFCSASWPRLLAFLAAQIPEDWKRRLNGLGADLKGSLGGWLRAQLILMGITFCELLGAFWLLGIESAPGMAALTAFVDALPLFGTGIILAPWALGCLLLGQSSQGLGLLIAWIAVSLVRNCIEAKLLGDQIGLHPLASLAAMYVGWQVWSVWGMLLFPVLLVTAQQLNDRGVVRLWRKV